MYPQQPGWGPGYQPPPPPRSTSGAVAPIIIGGTVGSCVYGAIASSSLAAAVPMTLLAFAFAALALAAKLGKIKHPFSSISAWFVAVPALAGTLAALFGVSSAVERRAAAERAEVDARSAAIRASVARSEAENEAARLRERSPAILSSVRAKLAAAQSQLTSMRLQEANVSVTEGQSALGPLLSLSPIPAGAAEARTELGAVAVQLQPLLAFQAALDQLRRDLETGEGADLIAFDEGLERAATGITNAAEPIRSRFGAAPAELLGRVERTRRGLRRRVAAERSARAAQAALTLRCGASPALGPWDGELIGSEAYLRRGAHDPDSIDVENCTVPRLTNRCWVSTCDVRGRNAFGATVLNAYEFSVEHSEIVSARRR